MIWFTDSPFERMMVQWPKTRKKMQSVSTVLLTEQDHDDRKQQNKEEKYVAWCNTKRPDSTESYAGKNGESRK